MKTESKTSQTQSKPQPRSGDSELKQLERLLNAFFASTGI